MTREAELARKDAEIAALKERLARASLPSKTDDAASHGDIVKPPRELFVSPVGSDTAVGTSAAAPLRTLAHARDTARSLRAGGNCNVIVNLLDGVFRLDAPLVFTREDSGTAWRSAPQNSAPARIAGATQVDFSTGTLSKDPRLPPAARGNVLSIELASVLGDDIDYGNWCAPVRSCVLGAADRLELFAPALPADSGSEPQLRPATLARYPNIDSPPGPHGTGSPFRGYMAIGAAPASPGAATIAVPWLGRGAQGLPAGDRPMRWRNSPQAMLHGMWSFQWTDNFVGLYNVSQTNESFGTYNVTNDGHYWPPREGMPYYILDLLEELDAEGEYWIDRAHGTLFFWPPSNLNATVAEISTCCNAKTARGIVGVPLVSLTNVSAFAFENIALGPGRGQGVDCNNCTDVSLSNLTVSNFNGMGITVSGGHNVTVSRVTVRDVGDAGVVVEGGDRERLLPSGHSVVDCDIGHFARWRTTAAPGIKMGGCGITAAHNEIHHAAHHGIEVWGNDMVMEGNDIHHVVLQTYDSGAIDNGYSGVTSGDLTWRGCRVTRNRFHSLGDEANYPLSPSQAKLARIQTAVYLDDHVSGWTVDHNIIASVNMGAFIHFGRDNDFHHNLFLEAGLAVAFEDCNCCNHCTEDGMCDKHLQLLNETRRWPAWPEYLARYPGLRNLTFPCQGWNNSLRSNAFVASSGVSQQWSTNTTLPVKWGEPPSCQSPASNFETASVAQAGFVSADPLRSLDFRLKNGSPVWAATGWTEQLPTQFGPRPLKADDSCFDAAELARKGAEIAALQGQLVRVSLPSKTDDAATVGRLPGSAIQELIDAAAALPKPAVVEVPAGDYDFAGESLLIAGHSQLTVRSTGSATLWFACGKGVHVANSSQVTVSGFTQDYTRPCFAQGVLRRLTVPSDPEDKHADAFADVEFDAEHFPLPQGPDYPPTKPPPPSGSGPPKSHIAVKLTLWDPTTLRIIVHGNHLVSSSTRLNGSLFRVAFSGCSDCVIPPGTLVTVHPRLGLSHGTGRPGGLTYLITNSSRVTTVNHTLHGSATEALVEAGGEGNHTWRSVRLVRREGQQPLRLLAANADGFHSSCVRIGPKLLDSELSFTGDDLLNIHSRMSFVLRPLGPTSAYIIDTEGSSSPGDYDESTYMFPETRSGDAIAFWHLTNLSSAGSATVVSATRCTLPSVIAEARGAWDAINSPPFSQHIGHDFGTRVWRVEWQQPVAVQRFAVVDAPRLRPTGAVVRNTHFHDAYTRFGLFESPGIVVQGNVFERAFPFFVGATGVGWVEGPPFVSGVTVVDNVARDCYQGDGGAFIAIAAKTGIQSFANNSCFDAAGAPVSPCTQNDDLYV